MCLFLVVPAVGEVYPDRPTSTDIDTCTVLRHHLFHHYRMFFVLGWRLRISSINSSKKSKNVDRLTALIFG